MTWLDSPLAALDTETTGTDPETARVVTACVGMSMAPGQWSPMEWRLNPGVPIPAGAAAVHGITDADVTDWSAPAETVFALSSDGGKECSTAADCRDGDRCERGRCVSSARKPAGAPKKTTNYDDGLALWWSPPHLRHDPFEPALASY